MGFTFLLGDLLKELGGESSVEGSVSGPICGIAALSEAQEGDLSFLGNPKYRSQVGSSRASVLLLPRDFDGSPGEGQVYVRVDNPSLALARFCRVIEARLWPKPAAGVHATAVIAATAVVDPSVSIGPFCCIGENVVIGPGVVVHSHVTIGSHVSVGEGSFIGANARVLDYSAIGKRVRIHSGAVIGSDGFGYDPGPTGLERIPQVGRVVVGDDVDIGANTTVDRARFGETRIGNGSKIDNLVQIGHNVRIGSHCVIVAQAGISGSTVIEDRVMVGGQVGVVGHLRIGEGARIGAQSGINRSLEAGAYVRGTPAEPFLLAQRMHALSRKLPDLFKRVANLEQLAK